MCPFITDGRCTVRRKNRTDRVLLRRCHRNSIGKRLTPVTAIAGGIHGTVANCIFHSGCDIGNATSGGLHNSFLTVPFNNIGCDTDIVRRRTPDEIEIISIQICGNRLRTENRLDPIRKIFYNKSQGGSRLTGKLKGCPHRVRENTLAANGHLLFFSLPDNGKTLSGDRSQIRRFQKIIGSSRRIGNIHRDRGGRRSQQLHIVGRNEQMPVLRVLNGVIHLHAPAAGIEIPAEERIIGKCKGIGSSSQINIAEHPGIAVQGQDIIRGSGGIGHAGPRSHGAGINGISLGIEHGIFQHRHICISIEQQGFQFGCCGIQFFSGGADRNIVFSCENRSGNGKIHRPGDNPVGILFAVCNDVPGNGKCPPGIIILRKPAADIDSRGDSVVPTCCLSGSCAAPSALSRHRYGSTKNTGTIQIGEIQTECRGIRLNGRTRSISSPAPSNHVPVRRYRAVKCQGILPLHGCGFCHGG